MQDYCTNSVRTNAQYLHDAPDGALMPGENKSHQPDERFRNLYHGNLLQKPESFDKLQADQPGSEDITTAVKDIPRTPTKLGRRTLESYLQPEDFEAAHDMRTIIRERERSRSSSPDQVVGAKASRRDRKGAHSLSSFQYTGATPLIDYDYSAQYKQQPQDISGGHRENFSNCSPGQASQADTPISRFPPAQDHDIVMSEYNIPPVPDSMEIHGDPHRYSYMQQSDSQQSLFDQRYHMRKDDAVC
jgi:hypothetical protein